MRNLKRSPGPVPGLMVIVLGVAPPSLVSALWASGLRPVRGQIGGTVWARPEWAVRP